MSKCCILLNGVKVGEGVKLNGWTIQSLLWTRYLGSAQGVFVDGGTVIVNVSDWRNGCVCVFSVHYDGQFVTSFGNGHIPDSYME